MQASFASETESGNAAAGQHSGSDPASTGSIGLAAFFAPAPQTQLAQTQLAQSLDQHIPGDFKAPEKPLLPPARPDFGDRVMAAATPAPSAQDHPAAEPRADALPNPQTITRAEAASLGAYEFKAAGVPMPEGGLRAANAGFAPSQFELAGVGQPGRWRPAYDNVNTDCFPATLRNALDQLATHFKSEVLVTSGKRERGRRGSMHRSCKAADIRVVGVSPGEVARVARTIPGINGVGTYRRVAVTHVDVRAERFAWRW